MTVHQKHILLVEDDGEIARGVSRILIQSGFRVSTVSDGRKADAVMRDARIDLIVLDLMLPGEDGLSICRRLRAWGGPPIIMLTAMGEEMDRVIGLEMGADDYLAKPFSSRELVARIRAVMRRTGDAGMAKPLAASVTFAGWVLDPAARHLHNPDGVRIMVTGAEFDLLAIFCARPGRVLTRDQLLDLTHGRGPTGPFDRSIDTLVSRLRQKIEADPKDPLFIRTVRLGGYMFTPEVTTS